MDGWMDGWMEEWMDVLVLDGRSADCLDFLVPRTRTALAQHQVFPIVNLSMWNDLSNKPKQDSNWGATLILSLPEDFPISSGLPCRERF